MNLFGKRVFVTGGNGFLGTYLTEALLARGVKEVRTVRSADHDLRDAAEALRVVQEIRPDLVIHAAGRVGGIQANKSAPYTFGRDNLLLGTSVLDACIACGVEKLVFVGSVCSYPAVPKSFPFSELDLESGMPEPTNANYGLAKRMIGTLIKAAFVEGRLKCGTTAILANLYGPGSGTLHERASAHVIPGLIQTFCGAVERGERQVELWGSGHPSRDFLHVRDAAEGICRVCEDWNIPDPINLGSNREITIRNLASLLAPMCGFDGEIRWANEGLDGQARRLLDTRLAHEALACRPKIMLEFGLYETVEWYRKQRENR